MLRTCCRRRRSGGGGGRAWPRARGAPTLLITVSPPWTSRPERRANRIPSPSRLTLHTRRGPSRRSGPSYAVSSAVALVCVHGTARGSCPPSPGRPTATYAASRPEVAPRAKAAQRASPAASGAPRSTPTASCTARRAARSSAAVPTRIALTFRSGEASASSPAVAQRGARPESHPVRPPTAAHARRAGPPRCGVERLPSWVSPPSACVSPPT